jgi:hypothetical protein
VRDAEAPHAPAAARIDCVEHQSSGLTVGSNRATDVLASARWTERVISGMKMSQDAKTTVALVAM